MAAWLAGRADFRKLDTETYAEYRKQPQKIDNIPLIGNASTDSIIWEKVLTAMSPLPGSRSFIRICGGASNGHLLD